MGIYGVSLAAGVFSLLWWDKAFVALALCNGVFWSVIGRWGRIFIIVVGWGVSECH